MSILLNWLGGREADEDMARAKTKPVDEAKVNAFVQQLKLAVRDGNAFKGVYDAIQEDDTLSAAELGAIAQGFAGGVKPKSKKAALAAIGQERLRIFHADAKAKSASKSKVW